MKNLTVVVAVLFFIGCNSSTKTATPEMPGVYVMESQTLKGDSGTNELRALKQLKIYTDDFFMYSQANLEDSIYAFGIGTYTINDSGKVVEHVMVSASDSNYYTEPQDYTLNITSDMDGYNQVIPEIKIAGETVELTEKYSRSKSGATQTTPLDGVWKEVSFYSVNGTDTTFTDRVQYKTFYQGYFMYGQVYKDSTNRTHTAMGFGSFTMPDNTHLKETDLNSSYAIVPGQTFDIEVEMMGADKYKQTLPNSDGSRNVEVYERMKK